MNYDVLKKIQSKIKLNIIKIKMFKKKCWKKYEFIDNND